MSVFSLYRYRLGHVIWVFSPEKIFNQERKVIAIAAPSLHRLMPASCHRSILSWQRMG